MDVSRRGFLGLLAGTVLAKVIGPKALAAPTEQAFRANLARKPSPINSYLPLESYATEMLRIIDEELAWLRNMGMQQVHARKWREGMTTRLGDTIWVRRPEVFTISGFDEEPPPPPSWPFGRRAFPVNIDTSIRTGLPLNLIDTDAPFGETSTLHLRPMALNMASFIERRVKRASGAKALVTIDPVVLPETERCVVAGEGEDGLSMRATQVWNQPERRWDLDFLMLMGLGG